MWLPAFAWLPVMGAAATMTFTRHTSHFTVTWVDMTMLGSMAIAAWILDRSAPPPAARGPLAGLFCAFAVAAYVVAIAITDSGSHWRYLPLHLANWWTLAAAAAILRAPDWRWAAALFLLPWAGFFLSLLGHMDLGGNGVYMIVIESGWLFPAALVTAALLASPIAPASIGAVAAGLGVPALRAWSWLMPGLWNFRGYQTMQAVAALIAMGLAAAVAAPSRNWRTVLTAVVVAALASIPVWNLLAPFFYDFGT